MGFEGKRIKPGQGPGTWKFTVGREVGEFWKENRWLVVAAAFFFLFAVLMRIVLSFSSPSVAPPQKKEAQQVEKEKIPRFVPPPFLYYAPKPQRPPWQKRDAIMPIDPIDWFGDDRYGRHYYGHYSSPHYSSPPYYSPYYSSPYSYENRQRGVDRGLPYFEQDERGFRWGRRPSRPNY